MLALAAFMSVLSGCAALPGRDPLRVQVVGVEPLKGEGLELRFAVRLRVQNPNASAVEFQGVSLDLRLQGQALASGVSSERGRIEPFSDWLMTIPLSVSALDAARQIYTFSKAADQEPIEYQLRGKLAGPFFAPIRFDTKGLLTPGRPDPAPRP